MNVTHSIGFDVHKKHISLCSKTANGELPGRQADCATFGVARMGQPAARTVARRDGSDLIQRLPLRQAETLRRTLGHGGSSDAKGLSAGKKKNDRIDGRTIADSVRCNLLPTCYVATPEIRALRRLLRDRNLVIRESVSMQKIAGLLMESGTRFIKDKLHGRKDFARLLDSLERYPTR
jgi:hypothetical protein